MRIVPIAEESLGVRSMAIYVEAGELRMIIDPGMSLAPRRYSLPPHPKEFERVRELRKILEKYAAEATSLFISHYHRDHYTVPYPSPYMGTSADSYVRIYSGKVILAKSPRDINYSQRRRYRILKRAIESIVKDYVHADGLEMRVGSALIKVSPSLPHGAEGSKTGRVIGITIIDDDSLTVVPDVQGPISSNVVDYVVEANPRTLIIGGPPLYLVGSAFSEEDILAGMRNLRKIMRYTNIEKLIIAHHTLRSLDWRKKLRDIFEEAKVRGVEVLTYAELLGKDEEPLEAMRPILYGEHGEPTQ